MSYDNTTPEEPMDATIPEQEPVDFGNDEFFFDIPEDVLEDDPEDVSEDPTVTDLDACINDTLCRLEPFRFAITQAPWAG